MSNKLLVILVIISLIFMCVMGGGLYLMWNKISSLDQTVNPPPEVEEEEVVEEEPVEEMGPMFSLDTFIVNLADNGGRRFLRITMDLELKVMILPMRLKNDWLRYEIVYLRYSLQKGSKTSIVLKAKSL